MIKWALNVDNFTLADRLKVAWFVMNRKNRLTMGRKVEEFEKLFGGLAQANALYVSSGSTANSLLAETYKQTHGAGVVIVPSTTWSTSVNPWIQAGFGIKFCDVNDKDFSLDLNRLEEIFVEMKRPVVFGGPRPKTIVFVTSLIGFVPDIYRLQSLCDAYGAELMFDNCENTLGSYDGKSILSFGTNTTSTYFGHQICSIEGGFLFTKDDDLYRKAKMIRNHGLTRALNLPSEQALKEEYEAAFPDVDPQFLFALVGNNFRNTEINALFGILDFARRNEYAKSRQDVYRFFYQQIDHSRFTVPSIDDDEQREHVPFCLPLICNDKVDLPILKSHLRSLGIEYRPIVGGNLLAQPVYRSYADPNQTYQNSRMLHNRGLYIGLHNKVSYGDINYLCENINEI